MSIKSAFSLFFFLLVSSLVFETAFPAFLAPITKDWSTQRYMITVYLNTPPHSTNLVLDLGASFTLLDCSSAAFHTTPYGSSSCSSFSSPPCRRVFPTETGSNSLSNSLTRKPPLMGEPMIGSLSMPVTDGRNPGQLGLIPRFVLSCTQRSLLKGVIAKDAAGLAGLGRSNLSIPVQVSNITSQNSVFALCLSGSPSAPGVAFFGSSGPYFISQIDLSKLLNYTPLLPDPSAGGSTVSSYANPSNEYFINLTSIKVNGKAIKFDQTLLGGTKLSTITPYTTLQSTIYTALAEAFVNESAALNLTVTAAVKPFRVCYKADDVTSTRVGPGVPTVDLVLQDDGLIWRIFGANSMVRIFRDDVDVWCLGVIDGGSHPKSAVVIGGHQMEDNLLQFDLEKKMLGFSSSVLVHGTMCGNFNFTTNDTLRIM